LGRKMVVDARAFDADIRRDLAKAEAAETAELHAPLSGIHDRSFNVLHAGLSINYLVIDSRCAGKRQLLSIYLSIDTAGERVRNTAIIVCRGGDSTVPADVG